MTGQGDCDQRHGWNYHLNYDGLGDHEYVVEVPVLFDGDPPLTIHVSAIGGGTVGERYTGHWAYLVVSGGQEIWHGDDLHTPAGRTHQEAAEDLAWFLVSKFPEKFPEDSQEYSRLAMFWTDDGEGDDGEGDDGEGDDGEGDSDSAEAEGKGVQAMTDDAVTRARRTWGSPIRTQNDYGEFITNGHAVDWAIQEFLPASVNDLRAVMQRVTPAGDSYAQVSSVGELLIMAAARREAWRALRAGDGHATEGKGAGA